MTLSRLQRIPNGVESVKKEIETMKHLDHKNIMGLIDVFDFNEKGTLYIVLEFVSGGTLSNFIDSIQQTKKKKIPLTQVRSLFSQLILALEHCHSQLVVHRDVKPSNILLMTDGTLKLSDFGEAQVLKQGKKENLSSSFSSSSSSSSFSSFGYSEKIQKTNNNPKLNEPKKKEIQKQLAKNYSIDRLIATDVGSPYFQCAEISRDETVSTFKADIFAAGVTLYKMITGKFPFNGSNKFELWKNIQKGHFQIPEYFGEELKDLMNGLLNNNEKQRLSIEKIKNHPWMTMKLQDKEGEEWFQIPEYTPKYEDDKDEQVQSLIPKILNSNSDEDDDEEDDDNVEYNSETGSSSDLSDGYYVSNLNKKKNNHKYEKKTQKKNNIKNNLGNNDDDDDDLSCCNIL
ncbi:serine/threonine-protein kinase stk11 [Anaeramoeba flamelloides]|uniref:Serine/threonine-protein kinase stk11 n=1 Tax=Anaeramoeba flamelloides TaxID=1746091 RepID=A0ABQ8Y175_9EUKA|nr:serine/threonine-protein kinase stk11 [Anaeramoeba flamelloides]